MKIPNLYKSRLETKIVLKFKIDMQWRILSCLSMKFFFCWMIMLFIQLPAHSQDLISNFEDGFNPQLEFARNFGLDIASESAPAITDDLNFVHQGNGALQIQSDSNFSDGFIVGTVFNFVPNANVLDTFNTISYWVRSENDHASQGMTGFIQVIMENGSIWEQFIQTPLTTEYQEVRVPLNPIGLRLSEDTVASECGDIDLENIANIAFVIFRGTSQGEELTAYFDDVHFIFDPNVPPILPTYSGLIDDFADPEQYNLDHQNDVIIPLFQELHGALTDDDRTMSPPEDPFFPNDRIFIVEETGLPDPKGILTLKWDNSDNTRPNAPNLDVFFSVLLEIGADISENSYFVMRMRGQNGGERISPLVTNQRNIRNAHPTVTLTNEFITYNLELSAFVDCEFRLQAIKTLTLDFQNNPNNSPTSGTIEIDNIGLSPFRHPNAINVTFPSGIPNQIDSGDALQVTVEVLDESGTPMNDFAGEVELSLPGGVVTPSTINGFDLNNGSVTVTANVFGDGDLEFVATDPLSNASSVPQTLNLLGIAEEVTDHFKITVGENHDNPVNPFFESTFPITITGFKDALETSEVEFSPTNQVAVTIESTIGEFHLLDNGNENVDELILASPTTTVRGFITGLDFQDQSTLPFALNVRFTSLPDQIKGTGTASLRNGSLPDAELEFLINQQTASGLLATTISGTTADIYTNALAVIAFTDAGGEEISRAVEILSAFRNLQIANGVNQGGFQDTYAINGTAIGADIPVSTFSNAWALMALNYYTMATEDSQFMDLSANLIDFLANRQILEENNSNFGGLFAEKTIPSGDPGGLAPTPGAEDLFITQDQAAAFSAFHVYAEMPWLTRASEREFYRNKAQQIKNFLTERLLISNLGAFSISSEINDIPSIEAQTAPFLAFIDEMDFSAAINLMLDPANNFLDSEIFEERQVSGAKFRRDPFSCPPDTIVHEQFIWIEGSSRVALALEFLNNLPNGSELNAASLELLSTNIQKVQHPSGGYPTHLGTQLDACPPVIVGDASISAVSAAWRYFSQVSQAINPYVALATAPKTIRVRTTSLAVEGVTDGEFTLEVDTILDEDLQVTYSIIGGSAGANDYQAVPGTATILQGQSQVTVPIVPILDNTDEGEETVILGISPSAQNTYNVGMPNTAELSIFDDPIDVISLGEEGTEISANPETITANGSSFSTITVQLKDGLNNNLAAQGIVVEIATTLGTLNTPTGVTNANGLFQATLTSTQTGTTNITGQIDTDANGIVDSTIVNGSPFQVIFTDDTDDDGVPDGPEGSDPDSDNDGIPDVIEGFDDTDGDGIPDFQDLDSDNDGINDVLEAGGTDTNGDGFQDGADNDGNGVVDSVDEGQGGVPLEIPDTDLDGIPDYQDLDSDNDSIGDLVESGSDGLDADGDGVLDGPDSDGDGIVDSVDGDDTVFGDANDTAPADTDNDGAPDHIDTDRDDQGSTDIVDAGNGDLDTNGDGMVDAATDADGDGIADEVDFDDSDFGGIADPSVDTDGDGIPDGAEGNGAVDSDGDGIPDTQDADSDNDGIPDATEGFGDTDGDGALDFQDLDSDNDGINDVLEAGGADTNGDGFQDGTDNDGNGVVDSVDEGQGGAPLEIPDTDLDGIPDYQDLDSDNDSIGDLVESGSNGLDADGDGVLDGPDSDGDGIVDSVDGDNTTFGDSNDTAPADTDNDEDPDYLDTDSDNQGPNDIAGAGNEDLDTNGDGMLDDATDADGDGITDEIDFDDSGFGGIADPFADTDGDGIPDGVEGNGDSDGDGIPDTQDADSDNDGIPDATEGFGDTDGDGVLDFQDLDSDNDGINDVLEAGGADTNGDGVQDGVDDDGNGVVDSVDEGQGGAPLEVPDTDLDGIPDYQDLDSDNDSIGDLVESGNGGLDADGDGVLDGPDSDGDGIVDSVDGDDTTFGDSNDTAPPDMDNDGDPDHVDTNSDNQGSTDIVDAGNEDLDANGDGMLDDATDADGDGIADEVDFDDSGFGGIADPFADTDGDGIPDGAEGNGDSDGDGIPDRQDADSDNDGIPDATEGFGDTDGDGVPDFQDLDSDNDGINDVLEAGGTDTNGDGFQDGTDNDSNGVVDSVDEGQGGAPLEVPDTDLDGRPDYQDLDSDNDSIGDLVESGSDGLDADGDGVLDGPDSDGDGIVDSVDGDDNGFGDSNDMAPADTDNDGDPDYVDTDSDNQGSTDIVDAGNGDLDTNGDGMVDDATDADGDGIADEVDFDDSGFGGIADPSVDTDGDGIPDGAEGNGAVDSDGDGIPDTQDADSDNDGIPDAIEGFDDTDGDGVPDFQDLDSDNDGINDVLEAGGADTNGDGIQDGTDNDANGVVDSVDQGQGGAPLEVPDTDMDNVPDYLDLDSDNDSIGDLVESGSDGLDADGDGVLDGPDSDGDGIVDSVDGDGTTFGDSNDIAPTDTDNDNQADYLSLDKDNDGTNDIDETGNGDFDSNGDGALDESTDADKDGIADVIDFNNTKFGGIAPLDPLIIRPPRNEDLTVRINGDLNFQTGLLEQVLIAENLSAFPISGFTVIIHGLPPNVSVYNAGEEEDGDDEGRFKIFYNETLDARGSVELLIEYFSLLLVSDFTPTVMIIMSDPVTVLSKPNGTVQDPTILKREDTILIEFDAVPEKRYAIQYSSDMVNWNTVIPSVKAVANRVLWIDNGPPKTVPHPKDVQARFYRIVEED